MMHKEQIEIIKAFVAASYDQYVRDLQTLVDIDSGTHTPHGVNRIADFMQRKFEAAGWVVERYPHSPVSGQPQLGDLIVARIEGTRPASEGGRRFLLIGHMDTVFPEGTVAERAFKIEGNRAYGPGVTDMKSGLLSGLYAVASLQQAGLADFASVTYICNPDEEIGSPFSRPFIRKHAAEVDVCFVLESARENGDIVSSRKGVARVRIVVRGRAAHAGVEPERGRSATLQAAYTIIDLHKLNGYWPGVSVNVGVVQGGTRPNVVAEKCELTVDIRATTAEVLDQVLAQVKQLTEVTVVPDTTAEVELIGRVPPMEKTGATAHLADAAKLIAARLGFELNDVATGGASDANRIGGLCDATLDGLGPIGGDDHSPREWLDLTSVVPRIALLAGLIGLDAKR